MFARWFERYAAQPAHQTEGGNVRAVIGFDIRAAEAETSATDQQSEKEDEEEASFLHREPQQRNQHLYQQEQRQQQHLAEPLQQSYFLDDSQHSSVSDGATQPLPAAVPALHLDATSDRDSEDSGSDCDVSGSEDFDLFQLSANRTKTSDYELNKRWGIDAGICSTDCTLADANEPPLKVGDPVFVLQLEWGDDSLGRLRNRLEARVFEFSERYPELVHIKYARLTFNRVFLLGLAAMMHKRSRLCVTGVLGTAKVPALPTAPVCGC